MYYAVAKGHKIGIFNTWIECKNAVNNYKYAKYRKFSTHEEAQQFLEENKVQINLESHVDYYVYTDGSCLSNGKLNSTAGIGIYFGKDDPRNMSKKLEGKQTNNTAELTAIIETYKIIEADIIANKNITIVSDSRYAILCATSYGKKCSKNNFIDIPNSNLVKTLYNLYNDKINVKFMHVMAHTNSSDIHSIGNKYADMLANNK